MSDFIYFTGDGFNFGNEMSNNRLKMICNNKACLNKGVVYRVTNIEGNYTCKGCGRQLVLTKSIREVAQNNKAKNELRELNG